MTFADLAVQNHIFLDANTLVYHFASHQVFGPAANQLMTRIENQDLGGYTSTHILSETAHRLMMIEAATLPGWKQTKVKLRLLQQPSALQNLSLFRRAIEAVLQSRIQTLTIAPSLVVSAAGISQQSGLLSNDALIVAVMQAHGLCQLASNDPDFDRVPGITRYAPG
ncbi:MAG TPA: type II toxin-antitoxin system VapC family toxin [Fimbriiglobus sp.]|nr:type II toxin-antitoxin system VapC family toxin [Fimbriiglobus sp.]